MVLTARALVAPSFHGPLEFQDVQLDELRPDEALIEMLVVVVGNTFEDSKCPFSSII